MYIVFDKVKAKASTKFFLKKGIFPIDIRGIMLYNKDTVEDTEGIGERLDMFGRGGGFYIYKSITKNFLKKSHFMLDR